jgi:hypothetical protein
MLKNLFDESKKRYDKLIYKANDGEKQSNNSSSCSINVQKLSKELDYTLYICNKISNIPFYNIYFQLIYNNKQLSFVSRSNTKNNDNSNAEIPLEYMKKIETDNSSKYVIINMDMKLTNSSCLYSYDDYFSLLFCRSKKEIYAKIFDIVFFILNALHILHQNGLFLLHFSKTNLCFNQIEIPFIQNFKYCIEKSDTINNIYNEFYNENINIPIELCVINYLKKHSHIQSLSNNNIETICKNYINNHKILNNISLNEKKIYYDESIQYLKPLINMPLTNSIEFMLKYVDTWDNYGFHIFFLNQILFTDIILLQLKTKNNIFWDGFIDLFMQNILCNPDKRHNIQQTKKLILEYLHKNTKYLRI